MSEGCEGEEGGEWKREGWGWGVRRVEEPNDSFPPPLLALIEVWGLPGRSYREALNKIKTGVSLEKHGIEEVVVRATPRGTALITDKEKDCRERSKVLAADMRKTLRTGGRVACPRKMVEVEVADFDPSTSASVIKEALTRAGGLPREDLSVGEIRKTRGGPGPSVDPAPPGWDDEDEVGEDPDWVDLRAAVPAG